LIRVFVGVAAGGEDAESCAVLEHTLRKHASEPVEITWMRIGHGPLFTGWNTLGWSTPFSGFRWAVPAACDYRGKAIYMDSDVLIRADIAQLWNQTIPAGKLALVKSGGKLRTCVMLMDCAAFRGLPYTVDVLKKVQNPNGTVTRWLKDHPEKLAHFEGQWNCLDLKGVSGLDDPDLKICHYSQMAHQVHLKHAIPRLAAQGRKHWYDGEIAPHWRPELQAEFDRLLTEAEAAGYHPAHYDWGGCGYDKRSYAGRPPKHAGTPC
jgi:hypothetical protein